MTFNERIDSLHKLGQFLQNFTKQDSFYSLSVKAKAINPFFTEDNIKYTLSYWAAMLSKDKLEDWLNKYISAINNIKTTKHVAIIAAGNIPLVSMHDVFSTFLVGHNTILKLSSKDPVLPKFIIESLIEIEPKTSSFFHICEEKLDVSFDAVIATGSNQSIPYFNTYFGKYPHIFRHHRNSIAILNGEETFEELQLLADDIFRYFGLGCRNVSKIYVPYKYNFELLQKALAKWQNIFYHHHYLNNYDYHKAIYIINKIPYIDGGFYILTENEKISSPLSIIFYEYYSDICILAAKLKESMSDIQCIVSKEDIGFQLTPFGYTQWPQWTDYADNIDVINFLIHI